MSENKSNSSYPSKRTDTLIGPTVRIEGNIDFRGVLRVQGDIVGDVASSADSPGTLVVDVAGSVRGAVEAPNLLVRGRVRAPTLTVQSLEIEAGAHCVGDLRYQRIDVHLGGVLEGLMTPTVGWAVAATAPETAAPVIETAASGGFAAPPEDQSLRPDSPGRRRWLASGLALVIAALAFYWLQRDADNNVPAPEPTPVATAPVSPDPAVVGNASPVGATAGAAASPVARGEATSVVPAASPAKPEPAMNKVVTVQGMNPAKSGGIVFLIAREPSVLFKKKRDDSSAGKQIELGQGRNVSVAVARNELLRVAKGRELEIFYQGRKVPPENIESGVWMRFEPLLAGEAPAAADPR